MTMTKNTKDEMVIELIKLFTVILENEKQNEEDNEKYEMKTIKELVEWCSENGNDIKYGSIQRWITSGALPAVKNGNKYMVRLSNFKKFLNGQASDNKEVNNEIDNKQLADRLNLLEILKAS